MSKSKLFMEPLVVVYVWKFFMQGEGVSPKSKCFEKLFFFWIFFKEGGGGLPNAKGFEESLFPLFGRFVVFQGIWRRITKIQTF